MAGGAPINGKVLAELRWLAGLTQSEFAAKCREMVKSCRMTREEVNAYENEREHPSLFTLNVMCAVLRLDQVSPERRALIRTPNLDAALAKVTGLQTALSGGGATNRNEFLMLLLTGSSGAMLPPLPGLADESPDHLYRQYATTPPADLIPSARLHAARVQDFDSICFVGWLAFMLDNRGEARACFTRARDMAADKRQKAQALLSLSNLHEGHRIAKDLIEEAVALAADADALTRMWAAIHLADMKAAAGERHDARAAMERAQRLLDKVDRDADDGLFSPAGRCAGWADEAYLAGQRAEGYVKLKDGRSAQAELQVAMASPNRNVRVRTIQLATSGVAWVLEGEPDPASEALIAAWDRATTTGHELGLRDVLEARALMPPKWSSHASVRRLDERLQQLA